MHHLSVILAAANHHHHHTDWTAIAAVAASASSVFTAIAATAAWISARASVRATEEANKAAAQSRQIAQQQSAETKQENNKNAFFYLLPELDNLTKSEQFRRFQSQFEAESDSAIDNDFANLDKSKLSENAKFLTWFSGELRGVSTSDHFRRDSLFSALNQLHKDADERRMALFRNAMNSRIGDEAARFLILQAVAEQDEKMLKIFGSIPLAFENLHRMPSLLEELARRYAASFADEIIARSKSIKAKS